MATETRLNYELTTEPFPLRASPATGSASIAKLTIVASNPNPDQPVTIRKISITIPVGPSGAELSIVQPPNPTAPADWKLSGTKPGDHLVEYDFKPETGQGQVGEQGLVFVFNAVQINMQPGIVNVMVVEEVSDDDAVRTLKITKFPAGWGQVTFWANPEIIPAGDSTTLNWSGPAGATYTIDYYIPQRGIVHVPAHGDPPLSNEGVYRPGGELARHTVFYLTVRANIDGQEYFARQSVIVMVQSVKITASGPDHAVNALDDVIIKWTTSSAKTVTLEPDHKTSDAASGSGQFTVQPASSTTYTLIAKDAKGNEKRAVVAISVNPPQIISFTAIPPAVAPGSSVTLKWETVSSAFTSLTPGMGRVKGSDSRKVTPSAGLSTYTLTAQSQPPFAIDTLNVIVRKPGFNLVSSDDAYRFVNGAFSIDKKLVLINPDRFRVWFSTDGLTLTPVPIEQPPREGNFGLVFDAGKGPRMWLLGGRDDQTSNDIWRSTDEIGTSWEKVQPANNKVWSPRRSFGCVVFKKKIWVFGGYDERLLNDVWSSPDGVNWTLETNNPGWSPRFLIAATTFTLAPSINQIWICGGSNEKGPTNEVYYTDDGIHWSQWTTTSIPWTPRGQALFQQIGDSLWLMGGNVSTLAVFRDVWSLDPRLGRWSLYIDEVPWGGKSTAAPATSVVFNGLMWMMGSNLRLLDVNPDIWNFLPR